MIFRGFLAQKEKRQINTILINKSMQSGWVIVYVPGGNIYQMLEGPGKTGQTIKQRIVRSGIKTFLAAAQLYYWLK
mgnify:CR=1 FL=1